MSLGVPKRWERRGGERGERREDILKKSSSQDQLGVLKERSVREEEREKERERFFLKRSCVGVLLKNHNMCSPWSSPQS